MKKPSLLIALMTATALLVTGFQVYWVVNTYGRERMFLSRQMNMMLRESVMEAGYLPLSLHLVESTTEGDSTSHDVKKMIHTTLREHGHGDFDLMERNSSAIAIFQTRDSVAVNCRVPGFPVFNGGRSLTGLDSMDLKIPDLDTISSIFHTRLKEENLHLKAELVLTLRPDTFPGPGKITLVAAAGFAEPQFAVATVEGFTPYLLIRILPQMGISALIVGLILFSFLTLYRNLRNHQRIAEQQRQLISNISHELKTPIATVSVALEALRNFHKMDNPARTQEYLAISQQEMGRLAMLTDKVLRLSLLEYGEMHLQIENCDLSELARQAVEALGIQAEHSGGILSLETEPGNYEMEGDRLHLTSCIINMIDNAIKYSSEAPVVKVKLSQTPDQLTLSVSDQGIGISREHQGKVFEKFYRVTQGDLHNVKGFGLGLSYVSQVVKRHGGSISLESRPGHGSTFTLQLPRKQHG